MVLIGVGACSSCSSPPQKSGFDLETALAKMETAAAALSTDDLEMKMAGVVGRSVTERFDLFASAM
jgi:hypothetical protein